ncbi:MAG: sensor histidine kinase [Anaerosporomusa subterranea]|nr:sensor histidine kinase [Anaerosporomusa subterranea]
MSINWPLVLDISRNVALIGICAYLTTRLPAIRRALAQLEFRLRDKLVLALVFGLFSAVGNWMGIPVMGSMANTRIVGPIAGGLIGGPLVGIGAGIIGAIPRYFMGGYTMWASVLANIIAGVVSGMAYRFLGFRRLEVKSALCTGFVCELILKGMVLALSKPFEQAWELEKIIGVPTVIANSLAAGLFVYIIHDVFQEQKKVQAQSAQQAMRMIQQTTEFLREGFNEKTALAVVHILLEETKAAAIAITDTEKVIAFVGVGADHHVVGSPIVTRVTQQALQTQQTVIVNKPGDIACPHPGCQITAMIDAPIVVDGQLSGSLKLCKINYETITPYEAEIVQGIADFLGLLLARRQLQEQKSMLTEAEYRMLKAQVNPHFLFNTLGAVRSLIRISPELARACVKDLSDLLRRALEHGEAMVSLREEMELVHAYVRLEKARFGERIRLEEFFTDTALNCKVPVFTLQPLVENAIRHGLSPKIEGGRLTIRILREDHHLFIEIEDDGVGISADRLTDIARFDGSSTKHTSGAGIGLNNVHKRLRLAFGSNYGLNITSQEGQGTRIRALIPDGQAKEESA